MPDLSLFALGCLLFLGMLSVLGLIADWVDRAEARDARRRNR